MLDRDLDMKMTGTRHPFLGRYAVAFQPDGALLATCGQDARICVHETARALRRAGEEHVVASFACAEPVTALALFSNRQVRKK